MNPLWLLQLYYLNSQRPNVGVWVVFDDYQPLRLGLGLLVLLGIGIWTRSYVAGPVRCCKPTGKDNAEGE